MPDWTIKQVNDAALLLRAEIDAEKDRIFDECGNMQVAEQQTNHLYDAITLLHELAQKEVL